MLSILIVNWNTRDLLRNCLRSIIAYPPSIAFELIVVDNASTDDSTGMVQREFPSVHLIASSRNTGYAAGNNLAFEVAQGNFLLTLNPDTEFEDQSLDEAIRVLEAHPNHGVLGIKQIGLDGSTQRSVRGFPSVIGILGDVTGLGKLAPHGALGSYRLSDFDYERPQDAPQPMGTFLLFRREALEAVGDPKKPFDESFPIFFNEVDLLLRLRRAGWPCYYTPEAWVRHHGGESTKQVRKSMIWESHRSLVRFLRKHAGTGWARLGLLLVAPIVYGAAFVRAKGYDAGFRA